MSKFSFLVSRVLPGCFFLSLLAASGCGSSPGRPTGEAVEGTVTLDGSPLDQGLIQFKPEDPKALFASAEIANGKYSISRGLGPQAGKYRVEINSPEGGPIVPSTDPAKAMEQASAPPPKERIPARYNATSELTADIKSGAANPHNFDLKSK